jgi:high affinity Mn2+ porin
MTSFARTAQGLAIATLAVAVQPALPAVAQTDDSRSGGSFYAGAHVGLMFGSPYATLSGPIGISSQSASNPYGALFGGVQAGWEYVFPSRLMLGIEADISFPNYVEASKVLS